MIAEISPFGRNDRNGKVGYMKKWICLMAALMLCILDNGSRCRLADAQKLGSFVMARLKYGGGGDWYGNPTSLPNLMAQLRQRLGMESAAEEAVVTPSDPNLFQYPLVYMNGHGTVRFTDTDVQVLREYIRRGGMIWADDNFGMDESFRKEIAKVFPGDALVEIPFDHPVFSMYYAFANGLPKIHEHYGGPPHLLGIFSEGRLSMLYTFNTDIGDGLESEGVHPQDSAEVREQAMQMAINIILYVLSN